ncbi:MAG: nuclear transport factor 2 family protein [Dehalococcoidia bacterium]
MTTGMSAAEQELAAAQRARFDATIAGDTAALQRLMGDDLTYFHSTGRQDTKQSFLEGLVTRNRPYRGFGVEDLHVRVFGDAGVTTAVVRLTLRNAEGVEDTHPSRCTQVWAKRDGGWQEVLWQATRIPE